MIEWIKNNLTLILAVYGGVLSTVAIIWNIYNNLLDKPKIKITTSIGFLTGAMNPSEPLLFIEAINKGKRPVTLSSVGIRLAKEENVTLMQVNLPAELGEGKSHVEWIALDKLRTELCTFAWYRDATGRLYQDKNIKKRLQKYFHPKNKTMGKIPTIRSLG